MSLVDWIKSLFGITPRRDVSRLSHGGGESDLDVIDERIDTSGGPLKEHHRRRALRDRRLLPKVKSPARRLGLTKRKNVMSVVEAERLFGATMRTRNRNLRDLLTDEEQLARYGLPLWKSEEDVALALGISPKELWYFSIHRERERQPHYVTFVIRKRSGGKRLIMAPKRRLKRIQRKLLELLVEKLPVSDRAHAFRRGRSIRSGAEPHVGRRSVLRLDLKDFFPTVTWTRVRGLLIAYGYSYPVATTLAVLMTEAERQPVEVEWNPSTGPSPGSGHSLRKAQAGRSGETGGSPAGSGGQVFFVPVGPRHCVQGAPTSPGLCNAVVLRLDRRLAGLARKHNLAYTRYADDLFFSGDLSRDAAQGIRQLAGRIIREEGFQVNAKKVRLMSQGTRQTVTGVVVNQVLGLSRQERRNLRAMQHRLSHSPADASTAKDRDWLRGKLAYLAMLNPGQASRLNNSASDI